jgi:hypothetical protein
MVFKFFRGAFLYLLKYSLNVILIVSWLIKLAAYFCQSHLIIGRVYCPMIKVDWLTDGALPANPPSQ